MSATSWYFTFYLIFVLTVYGNLFHKLFDDAETQNFKEAGDYEIQNEDFLALYR